MNIQQIKTMIEGAPNYLAGSMKQDGGKLSYTIREMEDFHCTAWLTAEGKICEATGGDSSLYTADQFRQFLYEGEA